MTLFHTHVFQYY